MAALFETEQLIQVIQDQPAIWDIDDYRYKDRFSKKQAWDDVYDTFYKDENKSEEEKAELIRNFQRRWKSLRDCFTRDLNQRCRKKNTYIHYNQLLFLKRVIKPDTGDSKKRKSNKKTIALTYPDEPSAEDVEIIKIEPGEIYESDSLAEEDASDPEYSNPATVEPPVKKQKVETLPAAATSSEEASSSNDPEEMFLLSLLRPLKMVPDEIRFGVRIEIMQVIQKAISQSY